MRDHSFGFCDLYLLQQMQGGQNFFEKIRTKIRTFSEKIRTIRTFLGKKSVQSVHFFLKKSVQSVQFLKKKSVQTVHLRKMKPFLKNTHQNSIFLLQFFIH